MRHAKFEGYPNDFELHPYEGSESTGVKGYNINDDYIIIQFKDNRTYLYNHLYPGAEHIKIMKEKALHGDRLGTYVNQNIRDNYFAYWDKTQKKFKLNKKFN